MSASLAQGQSVCLVNRRPLVRFQHEASFTWAIILNISFVQDPVIVAGTFSNSIWTFYEWFEAKGRFPLTTAFRISFKHSPPESHGRSAPRKNSVMVAPFFLLLILGAICVRFVWKATLKKIVCLIGSGAERLSSKQKAAGSIPAWGKFYVSYNLECLFPAGSSNPCCQTFK